MQTRKINIKAATKATAVKAATAKPANNKAQLAVAAATNDKLASGKPAVKPASFIKHDTSANYAGASQPFTSRKSRTPIEATFNRLDGYGLTDRDNAFLASLKAAYGKAEFPRLNADAGNLRRAIERGYIAYGKAPNTFTLTERALTARFA